jgi:Zn-dependent M28 family amino/carboxypeptidase
VQVKAEVAESWLTKAGRPLADIVKAIDTDLRPQPFALPDSFEVEMRVDVERETRMVRNVMAYLPGETGEYLIIGAHYDHIGLGEQYSMASSEAGKTPHLGADDNASGTAGVLELARWFSKQPRGRRGILFATFAAEEIGLLGSSYFTNNPPRPLDKAVAMINLDMIGRMREGKVYVGGVGTGTTFGSIVGGMNGNGASKLNIDTTTADGYGSSDHFSFTPKQVPVLFFFSGMHGDYHRPSDTWDKIDAPATAELLEYAGRVAEQLLAAPDRPRFVGVAEASSH